MTQDRVTILVVTHNSNREIASCLNFAKQSHAELLVIDNASTDGSAQTVERLGVPLIANTTNRGFAAAVNQGVRASTTSFLLLLNPDAQLLTGVEPLVRECEKPFAGAAGGKLIGAEGCPQTGFNVRRFPTPAALFLESLGMNRLWRANPVNWRYRCLGLNLTEPAEVDQPAGAFLMFRRDAWDRVGGFDEGYAPIWFEDVDFCKRLREAGFHIFFHPDAVAFHEGGHSVRLLEQVKRSEYWNRNLLRYTIRHFSTAGRIFVCLGVIVGSPLRFLFAGVSQWRTAILRTHVAVVRLAFRSLWARKGRLGESFS